MAALQTPFDCETGEQQQVNGSRNFKAYKAIGSVFVLGMIVGMAGLVAVEHYGLANSNITSLFFAFPVRGSSHASNSGIPRQPRIDSPHMSHFSTIKTKLYDRVLLAKSLMDMGVQNMIVAEETNSLPVRGYKGQKQNADIVVQQDNGHDIGFRFNGNEYELVSDLQFWQQKIPQENFLNQIAQRYSVNKVKQAAEEAGFNINEEVQDGLANKDIKITVSKFR
jgi:hypothetical protein